MPLLVDPCLPLASIPAAFPFAAIPGADKSPSCLSFPPARREIPARVGKRCRAVADLDGDGDSDSATPRPKKRRLRLTLITSRLSHPFAAPSTYISSRGAFIAARLAFQRRVGRSLLRKAALENWMRARRSHAAPAPAPAPRPPLDLLETQDMGIPIPVEGGTSWAAATGAGHHTTPVATDGTDDDADSVAGHQPIPVAADVTDDEVSVAGVSNYHAIDLEESPFDEGSWSDCPEEMEVDMSVVARSSRESTAAAGSRVHPYAKPVGPIDASLPRHPPGPCCRRGETPLALFAHAGKSESACV